MSNLYIGLMSGTSMDGVDVAVVDFSKIQPTIIAFDTFAYPASLHRLLNQLCSVGENEIINVGHCDRAVAQCFAHGVNKTLAKHNISDGNIRAIGSHGQTIRHHPNGATGFTLQIGDPNTLAVLTGIDVVADFRRKDIALGGQGAPLAPAFHQAVFRHSHHDRVLLNVGGISNISYIAQDVEKPIIGYDTGPGNTLMDAWIQKHLKQPYDENGNWAASGTRDGELLRSMLSDPYFSQTAPKSTGRETFHLAWIEKHLQQTKRSISAESVQATLCMLTCCSIADQIRKLDGVDQVFVCGGGAKNDFLMECLENELVEVDLFTTDDIGMSPDAVEAAAFAWLAYSYIHNKPSNLPSVTGASREAVLGGLYKAD